MKPRVASFALIVALGVAASALIAGLASERPAVLAGESPAVPPTAADDPWAPPAVVEHPALFYDRFETIGRADGLPSERVTCVVADGDVLAVGTDDGLAVRRAGVWTVYREKDGLAHRYVTSIARDAASGDLWIGTLRGMSRLTGATMRSYHQTDSGLPNDVVYDVVVDGGLVWAATAAGAGCLDVKSGAWSSFDVKNSIMHEPWCYAAAVGPGRAWVAVWGGGIVELDKKSGLWKEYRDPDGEMEIDLIRDDGPIHDVSSFVAYDAGVLWQSTYFGISRYDGRRWNTFTAADTGLPGDFVNQVAARGRTAWLATDQGLGVFDGETCVSYKRAKDGGCDVRVWRGGKEIERRTLATAPADDYVLWAQGGARDVWLATGRGLSHGIAGGGDQPKEK
jgi:ligand-binding sensor domain-containing protein